jgi:hypothetical protein
MQQLRYDYTFMLSDYVKEHGATSQEIEEQVPLLLRLRQEHFASGNSMGFMNLPFDQETHQQVRVLADEGDRFLDRLRVSLLSQSILIDGIDLGEETRIRYRSVEISRNGKDACPEADRVDREERDGVGEIFSGIGFSGSSEEQDIDAPILRSSQFGRFRLQERLRDIPRAFHGRGISGEADFRGERDDLKEEESHERKSEGESACQDDGEFFHK